MSASQSKEIGVPAEGLALAVSLQAHHLAELDTLPDLPVVQLIRAGIAAAATGIPIHPDPRRPFTIDCEHLVSVHDHPIGRCFAVNLKERA